MASELGSAVTPGGHQRLEGLLNREMATRQLNEQAASRRSGEEMARRQEALNREAMAQEVSENALRREHERGITKSQQEMQEREAQMHREFLLKQDEIQARREAMLMKYTADTRTAIANGQYQEVEPLTRKATELENRIAADHAVAAIVAKAKNLTQSQFENLMTDAQGNVTKKLAAVAQIENQVKNAAPTFREIHFRRQREAGVGALRGGLFADEIASQASPMGWNFMHWALNPNTVALRRSAENGEMPGLQYLTYQDPTAASIQGAWAHVTGSGRDSTGAYVKDIVDDTTMRHIVRGEMVDDITELAGKLGVAIKNPTAWKDALHLAFSDQPDQQAVANAFASAGVDPNMFHSLCSHIGDTIDNPESNNQLAADIKAAKDAAGGLDSMKSLGLAAKLKANRMRGEMARTARANIRVTGSGALQAALDRIEKMRRGKPVDRKELSDLLANPDVGISQQAAEGYSKSFEDWRQRESENDAAQAELPGLVEQRNEVLRRMQLAPLFSQTRAPAFPVDAIASPLSGNSNNSTGSTYSQP